MPTRSNQLRERYEAPTEIRTDRRPSIVAQLFSTLRRGSSQVAIAAPITDVQIYYGSMTGTAKKYANALAKEVAARGLQVTTSSLRQFDPSAFARASPHFRPDRVFVFVVATYGSGGPPPSAERFYQWLRHLSDQDSLPEEPTMVEIPPSPPANVIPESSSTLDGGSSDNNPRSRGAFEAIVSSIKYVLKWKERLHQSKQLKQDDHECDPLRLLHGMQYAVFGLGSSQYLAFNAMGKFVDSQLHTYGATRVCPLGLGDASNDVETTFLVWKNHFLQLLPVNSTIPSSDGGVPVIQAAPVVHNDHPTYRSESRVDDSTGSTDRTGTIDQIPITSKPPAVGKLRVMCKMMNEEEAKRAMAKRPSISSGDPVSRLTGRNNAHLHRKPSIRVQSIQLHGDGHSTHHRVAFVTMDVFDPDFVYEAGDVVALVPHNTRDVVDEVAKVFGFDLDAWFDLDFSEARDQHHHRQLLPFTTPCTIRTALTEYFELHSVTREFLRLASSYVPVDREREQLERLASVDGSEEFTKQFIRQHKGILELLTLAPSLKLPFDVFVNIAPTIKPRYYSIACSPKVMPHQLQLSVSLGGLIDVKGVSVSFFHQLLTMPTEELQQITMRAYPTASRFRLPFEVDAPMIMIANGVGVSPMHALLQHRLLQVEESQSRSALHGSSSKIILPALTPTKKKARNLLFFGCADPSCILYQHDFTAWEQQGWLHVRYAFSSQQGQPTQYVQDVVAMCVQEIYELIMTSPSARLYVCGKTDMARRIRQILQADKRSLIPDESNAVCWFDALSQSGRYIEEIWA